MTTTTNALQTSAEELTGQFETILKQSQQAQEQAAKIQVYADSAFKAAQQYKEFHSAFCKQLVHEFIQHHIYNACNSMEWETLEQEKKDVSQKIEDCLDIKELRALEGERKIIVSRIHRLFLQAVYLGALHDGNEYPETLDEISCKFVDNDDIFNQLSMLAKIEDRAIF